MTQTMPSITKDFSIKAVAPIPYTLYYGTFIHTPTLNNLDISFNTLVGVSSDGVIDYIYKEYNPLDHEGESPIEFFQLRSSSSSKEI